MEIVRIKRGVPLEQVTLNYAQGDRLSDWKEATLLRWQGEYKTPDGKPVEPNKVLLLTPNERDSVTGSLVPIRDYIVKQLGQRDREFTAFYAPGGFSFVHGGYRPGGGRTPLEPASRMRKIQFRLAGAIIAQVETLAEQDGVNKSDVLFEILQDGWIKAVNTPELLESPPEPQTESEVASLYVEQNFWEDLITQGNPGDRLSESATFTRLFLIGFEKFNAGAGNLRKNVQEPTQD